MHSILVGREAGQVKLSKDQRRLGYTLAVDEAGEESVACLVDTGTGVLRTLPGWLPPPALHGGVG